MERERRQNENDAFSEGKRTSDIDARSLCNDTDPMEEFVLEIT